MEYFGEKIGKFGFGLMRLPMIGDEVDIEQTKVMADMFLKSGFVYFDTAYGYINGKSEKAIKDVLVDRYPRESFKIATKLPAWAGPKTKEEAQQMFWTSLERTGAGFFDFYLLHNLGEARSQFFDDYDIWNFVMDLKQKGLIKHVGFSMHDSAAELEKILIAHPEMEFVQLQINYADWESGAVESRKCLEVCQKYGKPVIVMEPVKGGSLAALPEAAEQVLKQLDSEVSIASWAMRFAASLEGVMVVLSGVSDIEQMQDNLNTMTNFNPLSAGEYAAIEKVQAILQSFPTVPCTSCRYCVKDCPQNIPIPTILNAVNRVIVYGDVAPAKGNYFFATRDKGKASDCIGCGQCEAACPQHIVITEELQKAAAMFE